MRSSSNADVPIPPHDPMAAKVAQIPCGDIDGAYQPHAGAARAEVTAAHGGLGYAEAGRRPVDAQLLDRARDAFPVRLPTRAPDDEQYC